MHWNIGLDIGTRGVRMAIKGRGLLYRQSSAIALRKGSPEPLAVGNEALRMHSRTPPDVLVGFPLHGSAIANEELLYRWYQYLFRHATGAGLVHRPRVLISHAPDMQSVSLKTMVALALEAGAIGCSLIRSDISSALGAPLNITLPRATLVCDVGAGSMSAVLLAGGRVIRSHSVPYGMQRIDEAIIRRIRATHKVIIGPRTAEELKLRLIGATKASAPCTTMHAQDAITGFPKNFEVTSEEMGDAAKPLLDVLIELVHQLVDHVHPEVAADLTDHGVVLTGGGAQLFGLPLLVADQLSLPCHLAEDPSACAIRGLNTVMDNREKYEHFTTPHIKVLERRLPGK